MALPTEIIHDIYKHKFNLGQRQLHKEIKRYVADAHKRRKISTTAWLMNDDGKWMVEPFHSPCPIVWGRWSYCNTTASEYVTDNYIKDRFCYKNCGNYTQKQSVKSEAPIMEVYPAIYVWSHTRDEDVLVRKKRLGFEEFKPRQDQESCRLV